MRVLDASAFLAYLRDEPGWEPVRDAVADGCAMSIVNLAEALSTEASAGVDPDHLLSELRGSGLVDGAITVHQVSDEDSVEAARLRPLTRRAGLSLADRLCLALTRRLGGSAISADRSWGEVELGVTVELIR